MSLAFLPSDEDVFLSSEPQWKSRLGPGWIGTKVLGKGGHGVAGLWEYKGPAESAPAITQVVVKMSEAELPLFIEPETFPRSKIDEGVTLKRLAACQSKHIVKIFGGNRLGDRFGCMGEVVRIFLENCPGGDVSRFLAPYEQEPLAPLQEVDVWAIFHCMALGLAVMERGTEDPEVLERTDEDKYELVHFDLKPENIFLGKRDEGHVRMPIAKIGDFGEAYSVMRPRYQTDSDGSLPTKRGTEYYQPPEETLHDRFSSFFHIDCPWPRKGTCSNIWQIGTIMNQLLLRVQKRFDDEAAAAQCKPTSFNPSRHRLVEYRNHSLDLETPEITALYSIPLITLVMECLLRPTNVRPTATELVQRTKEGYQVALEELALQKGKDKPLPPPPDMKEIVYASTADPEPPLAWEVDDTTPEYLYASHHASQKSDVYTSPSTSVSKGSVWSGFLPSIFSKPKTPTPGMRPRSTGLNSEESMSPKVAGGGGEKIAEGWEEVKRRESFVKVEEEDHDMVEIRQPRDREKKVGSPMRGKKSPRVKLESAGRVMKSSPKKKPRR